MSYTIKEKKKIKKNRAKLGIEISANYYRKQVGNAYREISNKAKIPGFRKGKVPAAVIDSNFGKSYVLQEAASRSISQLYPEIIQESEFKPIDYPKIDIKQMEEGKPLGFEAEIELEPEITLPKYKGITVNAIPVKVSQEEIQEQIDNMRKNFATLEPAEEGSPAGGGDFVTIDFKGRIGGKEFEGGSAEDYSLEIGSGTLFPEFETSIKGMKKGERKQVSLLLPDNIGNQEIVGKKADFDIYVKEIKKRVLPELDQDLLKNLGGYKSADEFREQLEKRLLEQKENQRQSMIIGQIIEHIADNMKDSIPEPMIRNSIDRINKEMDEGLKKQKLTRQAYMKALNITQDQLEKQIRQRAEQEVRDYLIFKALEKSESGSIQPTEEEMEKEKEAILSKYPKEEDSKKVKEYFDREEGSVQLKETVKRRKLMDRLEDSVKVVEEEPKADKIDDNKKIWTPEEEKKETKKGLWTPGAEKEKSEDKDE